MPETRWPSKSASRYTAGEGRGASSRCRAGTSFENACARRTSGRNRPADCRSVLPWTDRCSPGSGYRGCAACGPRRSASSLKFGMQIELLPNPPPEVGLAGTRQRRRHQGVA